MIKNPRYSLLVAGGSASGFTILEVLVAIFIVGTVMTGVFGLFVLSLRLANDSERRVVAIALANERMEMVRNLPYVDVGTVGGIPSGGIPQEETITRNGLPYTVRTDIRYVDDPFDGTIPGSSEGDEKVTICHQPGTPAEVTITVDDSALPAHLAHGDTTGACGSGGEGTEEGDLFNADYKQVRVEVSWQSPHTVRPVLLITHIVPDGIEGGELGGTLDFLALTAAGSAVPEAAVEIVNGATDPTVDIATQTNEEGRVVLPALPEGSGYAISVSKEGYTSEQTYDQTETFFPDADHSHLSMITGQVTPKTFFIDLISELAVNTEEEGPGNSTPPVGNVAYNLRGTKTIGTDDQGELVYVLDEDATTSPSGKNTHENVVWDTYDITIDGDATGYDIQETSIPLPVMIAPGTEIEIDVRLIEHTPISLQVTVVSSSGDPIDNATIHLIGNGFDETLGTGEFGQVYFGDLPADGDYTLTIDAPGYLTSEQTVQVAGTTRVRITLSPLS